MGKSVTARICGGIAAAAILSACTPTTSAPDRSITRNYHMDGIRWQSDDSVLAVIFDIFEVEGKVSVCGAYTFDKDRKGSTTSLSELAINSMKIRLGDELLVSDISFFKRVPFPESGFPKGQAGCVITERAWADGMGDTLEPELVAERRYFTYRD